MGSLFHTCPLCSGSGYLDAGVVLDHPDRPKAREHVPAFIRCLRPGLANVQSSYEIAERMGVPQRSVGFIANAARDEGFLVGSAHGEGYYLIQTRHELDLTMRHIRGRVHGIGRTLSNLDEAWHAHAGGVDS